VIFFFLAYAIVLTFGSLEGIPPSNKGGRFFPFLTDKPLTEDGYYMLTVAWNIAEGKGFTYNNNIRTTGVQPLATLLYSSVALLIQGVDGDKYDFVRAVLILGALFQVLFAFLICRIALAISGNPDNGLYLLISICVVLLNFKVLLIFDNGLETGLYLILLSIFFLYWIKNNSAKNNLKHIFGLGIISGLLLLCRLDSVILLFTFYSLLLFDHRIRIRHLILIAVIAFLLYLPWQIHVFDVTGNILQSSARSQTGFVPLFDFSNKTEQYFTSILQHLTPFLFTGNILVWLMIPLGILYLAFFYFLYRNYRLKLFSTSAFKMLRTIIISFLVLIIIYFFFSSASYFYIRYLAFIMVISFPVFVVLFAEFYKRFRIVRIAALFLIFTFFILQAMLYLHSGKSIRTFSARAGFVKENFSKEVRVAAFQTGVLGYLCDNIINLDGKMDNSALQNISTRSLDKYLDSMNVDVLIEWKDLIIYFFDEEYLKTNWKVYTEDIGDGRTICYVRIKY